MNDSTPNWSTNPDNKKNPKTEKGFSGHSGSRYTGMSNGSETRDKYSSTTTADFDLGAAFSDYIMNDPGLVHEYQKLFNKRAPAETQRPHTHNHPVHDDLFEKGSAKPVPDDVQYFRSLSNTGPILSDEFLPKAPSEQARNPFVAAADDHYRTTKARDNSMAWNELDHEDDNEISSRQPPSGEWTSPVVTEALRRQVSKESQFRMLCTSIAWLFGARLFFLICDKCIQLYRVQFPEQTEIYSAKSGFSYMLRYVGSAGGQILGWSRYLIWYLGLLVLINAIRLAWPQDQCADLPLTPEQRTLIGLKPCPKGRHTQDPGDADLVMSQRLFEEKTRSSLTIPRYTRQSKLSSFMHRNGAESQADEAIALTDEKPHQKMMHF
ncbi:hypothetical protein OXX59_004888 [Metschnikowia pulcherrima]